MVLSLLACIGRGAPQAAADGTTLRVVSIVESVATGEVLAAPSALLDSVQQTTSARGIAGANFDIIPVLEPFSRHRDTRSRIGLLPPYSGATLFVETQPSFYSEMNGKYRWTVRVRLTVSPSDYNDTFDVPVFLQFYHERDEAAVAAAAPVIARHTAQLLDAWLAAP